MATELGIHSSGLLPAALYDVGWASRPCAAANWLPSGSSITSMARARCGSRRINPRSTSAVIRRWMPDLRSRSRASFISSKEGGTPSAVPLVNEEQELFLFPREHHASCAHAGSGTLARSGRYPVARSTTCPLIQRAHPRAYPFARRSHTRSPVHTSINTRICVRILVQSPPPTEPARPPMPTLASPRRRHDRAVGCEGRRSRTGRRLERPIGLSALDDGPGQTMNVPYPFARCSARGDLTTQRKIGDQKSSGRIGTSAPAVSGAGAPAGRMIRQSAAA